MTTDTTDTQTSGGSDAITDHVEQLWRAMLKRDHVAHDDNFADLGGDSLLLLAIMNELEETYDIELDVEEFVQNLTVSGMAALVAETRAR